MKTIKNNLFNRIFRNSVVKENKAFAAKCISRFTSAPELVNKIENCTSLTQLVELHKAAFSKGFDSKNLDTDPFGMFRAKSIESMQPGDVYLGGRYGINTQNILFWECCKGEEIGYNGFGINPKSSLYNIMLNQYKDFLLQNIKHLSQISKISYKKLEELRYTEK